MSHAQHFVGDIGTAFTLTVQDQDCAPVDLSTQTSLAVLFLRPDGVGFERAASVVNAPGTDGVLRYVTVAGDLSQEGRWSVQGRVVIDAGTFHTTAVHFEVRRTLGS